MTSISLNLNLAIPAKINLAVIQSKKIEILKVNKFREI